MTTNPMIPALQLIRDAFDDLAQLEQEWDRYSQPHLSDVILPEFDSQSHVLKYSVCLQSKIPAAKFAKRVRHIAVDLRSSLDRLIHGIAAESGIGEVPMLAMPVVFEDEKWDKRVKNDAFMRRLPAYIPRLRAIQPFEVPRVGVEKGGQPFHPLALLSEIANSEKHRGGIAVRLVPEVKSGRQLLIDKLEFSIPLDSEVVRHLNSGGSAEERVEVLDLNLGLLQHGDTVLAIKLPEDIDAASLQPGKIPLPLALAADLALEGLQEPLLPALREAGAWVRDVVPFIYGSSHQPPNLRRIHHLDLSVFADTGESNV